jgi:hypothetical protein
MHDNLLSVIITRKWQLAESYHAVELQTESRSELPSFDHGACVTVVLDNAIYKERTYPLCCSTSRPRAYVIAVRQAAGDSDTETADISLSQGDEAFIAMPRSPEVFWTVAHGRYFFLEALALHRSRESRIGLLRQVKYSSCTTSLDHLNVQSFGRNLTRSKAKVGSITTLAWILTY